MGLALWFLRHPLKQIISIGTSLSARWVTRVARRRSKNDEFQRKDEPPRFRRFCLSFLTWRRLVFATLVLFVIVTLLVPWSASVGNYGTLAVIPGQEAIIRAPESASLIELRVTPGDRLASGAIVGRMRSVELDDQTAEVQSELARARTEHHRLQGELRAHEELADRAEVQWRQRQHDHDELAAEQQQINARDKCQAAADGGRMPRAQYPSAIAVLEADVELRQARLAEANKQLDRALSLSPAKASSQSRKRKVRKPIHPPSRSNAAPRGSDWKRPWLNIDGSTPAPAPICCWPVPISKPSRRRFRNSMAS